VYKEKEIIREIVKVPCDYCGSLVDVTSEHCPGCGAPFKSR
jgi:RNA polymerase subunit RPABC4/transcription elongation factor Spt4